jgi:hypothetical protein
MRTWTTRSCTLTLALVSALGLAACNGGDDRPTTTTTSSTTSSSSTTSTSSTTTASPSTTTSATIDPAKLPPEATKQSEAGAQAFAKFYWQQAAESLVTNDASLVSAMAVPECKECGAFQRIVAKQRADGVHSKSSSYRIELVRTVDGSGAQYIISVAGKEVPVEKVDASGKVTSTSQPGLFSWATSVAWDGGWRVVKFQKET